MGKVQKQDKEKMFWATKTGKNIRSYGILLCVSGVLYILFAAFLLFVLLPSASTTQSIAPVGTTTKSSAETMVTLYGLFGFLFGGAGIYFLVLGIQMSSQNITPMGLRTCTILNIFLSFLSIGGIIGIFILIDACRGIKWSGQYDEALNRGLRSTEIGKQMLAQNSKTTKSKVQQKTDDGGGGIILFICILIAIAIIGITIVTTSQ